MGLEAVPSAHEIAHLPWRVGTHYGIHVYAVLPEFSDADDVPVATFHHPSVAQRAVEEHNAALDEMPPASPYRSAIVLPEAADSILDSSRSASEVDKADLVVREGDGMVFKDRHGKGMVRDLELLERARELPSPKDV